MGRSSPALAVLALTACVGGRGPEHAGPPAPRIVRASDGAELTFDQLVGALAPARVVYLGERHDRASDHEMQRAVTVALLERDPSVALGFEMFQRPYQEHLDAYVAGSLDEAELLARTEWEDRWGFDFAMYRPLVSLGARRHRPLLALNAPQEITRAVGREGLETLSEEQRATLPELDLEDEAHRAAVMEALSGHPGMSEEVLARFYAAQVIWDETMARTVARYLAREDAARRVIVYAGVMHVMRRAIPARVERRVEAPGAIVFPVSEADLEEARALADYLWVTPASEAR